MLSLPEGTNKVFELNWIELNIDRVPSEDHDKFV